MPVSITDNANGLLSSDLNITYDGSDLALANVIAVPAGWTAVSNIDDATGLVRISEFSGSNPLGSGPATLLDLQFDVAANALTGVYPLTILTQPTVIDGNTIPASRFNEGHLASRAANLGGVRVPIGRDDQQCPGERS